MVQTCLDVSFPIYARRDMGEAPSFTWYSKVKEGWTSTAFDYRNPINQVGPNIPCNVGKQIFSGFDETPFEGAGLLNHPFKKESLFHFTAANIEAMITASVFVYSINFTATFYDFVNDATQLVETARYRANRYNGVWTFFEQPLNQPEVPIAEIPPMVADVDFNAYVVFSVSLADIDGDPTPPPTGTMAVTYELDYLANYDMGKWMCCATSGRCCTKSPRIMNITNMTYGIPSK